MSKMNAQKNTAWLGKDHLHFDRLPSTNDYLKQHAKALSHGTVVTADYQTAGKGRVGRTWQDSARKGLAFSVLLRPPSVHHTQLLPLVCALGVKSSLEMLCGVNAQIKWPNDIVLNGKKVCGILCEGVLLGDASYAICGIGLNVLQETQDFASFGLDHATSLLIETGKAYPLKDITAVLMSRLEHYYDRLIAEGFDPLLAQYRQACITLGRDVRVLQNGSEREGRAVGLSPNGALLVDFDGTIVEVNAGEASVRGLYGYV